MYSPSMYTNQRLATVAEHGTVFMFHGVDASNEATLGSIGVGDGGHCV